MIPNLPPLQSLRAFEAAARHLGYTRAAEELHLTHGAISHHIARLERDLGGVRLFVRDGHRMLLTEAGQIFLLEAREALYALATAFDNARLRSRSARPPTLLNLSVLPGFAARWLLPRLSRFQDRHPGIDIAVRPTASIATLDSRDGVDIAVRYGPGTWPGLEARLLMKSYVSPLCSPDLVGGGRLPDLADLSKLVLLRNPRQKWRPWFVAAGLDWHEPTRGPIYDDAGLLLQAAVAGQGVALGRLALAMEDLAAGRLVELSEVRVEDEYAWYVVWREPLKCDRDAFDAFRTWLIDEARPPVDQGTTK
jgi:LysR family transcriptional regulator, glycine cleavage system transcriptional activator